MNCILNKILIILIILLVLVNFSSICNICNINNLKNNILNNLSCKVSSYEKAKATSFIKDNNNFKYNHKYPEDFTKLRNIKANNENIEDFLNNFMEMDYTKYYKNIDIDKLENIEI